MNNILNLDEIKEIKSCGQILAGAMDVVSKLIQPGVSTLELDHIVESYLTQHGARPAFKGYEVPGSYPFPASICASINDEVVHGIPRPDVILQEGMIISIDIGAEYHGLNTDMAKTFSVGIVPRRTEELLQVTESCLYAGIKSAIAGNRIGAIGKSVQTLAESHGFNVVRDLVGHGIGRKVHMPPNIPNYGNGSYMPIIQEGMALAIEPMLTIGSYEIRVLDDQWTISTYDGNLSAHFEHTVVIENGKPVIVTKV